MRVRSPLNGTANSKIRPVGFALQTILDDKRLPPVHAGWLAADPIS
jgi:hypothetical protein